ncbi:imidazole glycerol phosphate synthase subunit HisF [Paucibacter aquatile]|uniref:imidazole glycerol-phosphate synthase n=1 Tax=Kinneretia aquatilis TaxID=2070761 RepID=A0A2N8KWE5_9BURK|nr:AglZ/HisF2 family acetamidino modification protein [Paucibacter aquatile]PND37775.1 imidazole glycerol phosphate synthase subunit HisF [Paucibacter aquatile]
MPSDSFNPFRVIPVLLLEEGRLVKTIRFSKPSYVGDLINSVRIFNEKEVDELAILDIGASKRGLSPNFDLIKDVTNECFMPLAYGGGISDANQVRKLVEMGVEKVIINSAAMARPALVSEAAKEVGSQSVVVSIDIKKTLFGGYQARSVSGTKKVAAASLQALVKDFVEAGAGEILLNNIDRDGTLLGYDHALLKQVCTVASVPVISCGGAADVADLGKAVAQSGASACAAGALFTFRGPHRAVLLSYPKPAEVNEALRTSSIP